MKEGFISALEKVDVRMAEKNFKINQSVYVVMYISDMSSYLSLNETYNEKFHFQNPPPRICVETCLPAKCQIILEILFYRNPEKVESFHVQGMWVIIYIEYITSFFKFTFFSVRTGLPQISAHTLSWRQSRTWHWSVDRLDLFPAAWTSLQVELKMKTNSHCDTLNVL